MDWSFSELAIHQHGKVYSSLNQTIHEHILVNSIPQTERFQTSSGRL